MRFEFSDDWDGLTRTAVFRAGDESRSVLLDNSNEALIPWEVLRRPNLQLFCGVYGTRNGGAVLPTIWADMGAIFRGTEPSEEEAQPPTPDIWEQKLDAKADGFDYDGLNLSLMSGDRTEVTTPILNGLRGVTYGDGRFVAVRQGGTDAAYSFTGNDTPAGIQRIGESVLAENSHFELEGIPSAATYSGNFI